MFKIEHSAQKNGPNGENLVCLLQHSDAVLKAVVDLADQRDLRAPAGVAGLRRHLVGILAAIDRT